MKCPNCGAELKSANYCEYCGSEFSNPQDNPSTDAASNVSKNTSNSSVVGKCPKCSSTNIKFHREKIRSLSNTQSNRSSAQNPYQTIGLCQTCGYTWNPNINNSNHQAKSKGCFWWFLMFIVFPIPLSIWFYKTDKIKLEKKWKILIIAIFWIVLLIYSNAAPDTAQSENNTAATSTITQTTSPATSTVHEPKSNEHTEETRQPEDNEFHVIDTFIEKYNATAATPMTEPVIINIRDKDSEHYRREYRTLNNALAKQCKIGDATIDIVSTYDFLSGSNIRIYLHTESVDFAGEVFSTIVKLVYPEITDNELSNARNQLNQERSSPLNDIVFYYIQSYNELFMNNVMYAE